MHRHIVGGRICNNKVSLKLLLDIFSRFVRPEKGNTGIAEQCSFNALRLLSGVPHSAIAFRATRGNRPAQTRCLLFAGTSLLETIQYRWCHLYWDSRTIPPTWNRDAFDRATELHGINPAVQLSSFIKLLRWDGIQTNNYTMIHIFLSRDLLRLYSFTR